MKILICLGIDYNLSFSYTSNAEKFENQPIHTETTCNSTNKFHSQENCCTSFKSQSSVKIEKNTDVQVNKSHYSSLTEESAIDSNDYMDFSISLRSLFSN